MLKLTTFDKKEISIPTGLFIDGKFVQSVSGKTISTVNPSTGEEICKVAEGDKADIDKAVESAKKGLKLWSNLQVTQRQELLYKVAETIQNHSDELAYVEALDQGKPYTIAKKYDVAATAFTFKYYAGWCDKFYSKYIPAQNNEIAYTRNEPYGITAGIIPWNYPLMFIGWKAAPSLACGNVIIIKPSEKTPLSALYFAYLIKDILPPGVINIVNGYGPTAGAAICEHMDIKKIAFTGSTPVGRKILEMSSKSNLKKVGLELGGKSPNIICDDADLKLAVASAAQSQIRFLIGVFANAGQVCCACSRIYVQEKIYDQFVEKFWAYAQNMKLHDQWKNLPFYIGPVVDKLQFNTISKYVETGINEGAKMQGEKPDLNQKGYFIKPILFTNCSDDMTIVKEEIFGPVAVVLKFKSIDEVIQRANNSNYGLGAAIFSQNIDNCHYISNKLEAGTVWINNILLDVYSQQLPFGGYKESGFGREGSDYALNEWSQVKTIKIKIASKL